jgi:hypothetical protein
MNGRRAAATVSRTYAPNTEACERALQLLLAAGRLKKGLQEKAAAKPMK